MKTIPFIVDSTDDYPYCINGYVAISPDSTFYEMGWDNSYIDRLTVHGGVTYSHKAKGSPITKKAIFIGKEKEIPEDYWILGFDTKHYEDTPEKWDQDAVAKETLAFEQDIHQKDEGPVIQVKATITQEDIKRSLEVLKDNGIDEDECETVLQALGYTILDTELFPDRQ